MAERPKVDPEQFVLPDLPEGFRGRSTDTEVDASTYRWLENANSAARDIRTLVLKAGGNEFTVVRGDGPKAWHNNLHVSAVSDQSLLIEAQAEHRLDECAQQVASALIAVLSKMSGACILHFLTAREIGSSKLTVRIEKSNMGGVRIYDSGSLYFGTDRGQAFIARLEKKVNARFVEYLRDRLSINGEMEVREKEKADEFDDDDNLNISIVPANWDNILSNISQLCVRIEVERFSNDILVDLEIKWYPGITTRFFKELIEGDVSF